MENRKKNDTYRRVAESLIAVTPELEYIKNSDVRIIYLQSDLAKKKSTSIVHGECEKVASKNKWAIDCDFTITLYEPNNVAMTEEQISILMFHELLHVGIDVDMYGQEKYFIKPHDLEDFKVIINKFGTDWSQSEGGKE